MTMALTTKELKLHGLRGAITSQNNSVAAIEAAVTELVKELVDRNRLSPEQIISITFSVTTDLDACFPAAIARRHPGWENVALLDCQQMFVANDLKNCIRMLAHVLLPENQKPQHPYLGKASLLRPDRSPNN